MKFGFVILNYKTLEEGVAAAESVRNLVPPDDTEVRTYVVDNGSPPEIQEGLVSRLGGHERTRLILSKENLGFARGNNLGIETGLDDGCAFVACLNNDVLVRSDRGFFRKILDAYAADAEIAVIGPDIVTPTGLHQNPYREERLTAVEAGWFRRTYLTRLGWVKYWLQMYWIPRLSRRLRNPVPKGDLPVRDNRTSRYVHALHGSFVVFTPTFFRHFGGFDGETFLFGEELALGEKVRQKGLRCWYLSDLEVFHTEDVSTDATVDSASKMKFFLKHQYDSMRFMTRRYLTSQASGGHVGRYKT